MIDDASLTLQINALERAIRAHVDRHADALDIAQRGVDGLEAALAGQIAERLELWFLAGYGLVCSTWRCANGS